MWPSFHATVGTCRVAAGKVAETGRKKIIIMTMTMTTIMMMTALLFTNEMPLAKRHGNDLEITKTGKKNA